MADGSSCESRSQHLFAEPVKILLVCGVCCSLWNEVFEI